MFTTSILSKNMSDMQISLNFDNSVHVKHTKFAEVAGNVCLTVKRLRIILHKNKDVEQLHL